MMVVRMDVAVTVERAPALLPGLAAERSEDRGAALPGDTEAREQLLHGRVVRHEKIVAVPGQGKVAVSHPEGNTHSPLHPPGRHPPHALSRALPLLIHNALHPAALT